MLVETKLYSSMGSLGLLEEACCAARNVSAGSRRSGKNNQRKPGALPNRLAVDWCDRRDHAGVDVQGQNERRSGEGCRGREHRSLAAHAGARARQSPLDSAERGEGGDIRESAWLSRKMRRRSPLDTMPQR